MFRAPTLIAAALAFAFGAGFLFLVVRGGCGAEKVPSEQAEGQLVRG
jgi:hypothetical protein